MRQNISIKRPQIGRLSLGLTGTFQALFLMQLNYFLGSERSTLAGDLFCTCHISTLVGGVRSAYATSVLCRTFILRPNSVYSKQNSEKSEPKLSYQGSFER